MSYLSCRISVVISSINESEGTVIHENVESATFKKKAKVLNGKVYILQAFHTCPKFHLGGGGGLYIKTQRWSFF